MKKRLLMVAILSMLCISNFSIVTLAADAYPSAANSQIEERADAYEWRYKVVNGKLYRRFFNLTKAEWVGDWELVP